jgi:hypothetical protein
VDNQKPDVAGGIIIVVVIKIRWQCNYLKDVGQGDGAMDDSCHQDISTRT